MLEPPESPGYGYDGRDNATGLGNQQETLGPWETVRGYLRRVCPLHSKRKGNIGQLATANCLARFGFSIFIEAGDISKIDVIAELNGLILTFQCKAITSERGKIVVPLRKCGPNYVYRYCEGSFDYFAVYDLTDEKLYLLPGSILRGNTNTFVLRKDLSKNNQRKGVHVAEDYLAERILRDYTGDTRPVRPRVEI